MIRANFSVAEYVNADSDCFGETMLKSMHLQQTNRPLDVVRHWAKDLLLNPPYQRGDVWGAKRRVNLIRSILLGVPIPSMIINDRMGGEWPNGDYRIAVIDGKQRLTTILMFFADELAVPGDWFGEAGIVRYSDLPRVRQRGFENRPLPFSEGRLPTLEAEQEVFDLVNFGGLAQGEIDAEVA